MSPADPIAAYELQDRPAEPRPHAPAADGSGLGLATCLRIVEAHGGEIGLSPAPGGGTVAGFTLPDPS